MKVSKVIAVAKNEVGYLEKKSNKDLDSKTANAGYNNYTKYGKWLGLNPAYWCAMFICWIFAQAYGKEDGKKLLCGGFSAACETIRQNFIKSKRYTTTNPKAGYVIFFSGTRHAGANHIGLVYKVSGGVVYTIEGNTSTTGGVVDNGGGVSYKQYSAGNSRIMGYGMPEYTEDVGASGNASNQTSGKSTSYYPKYTGSSKKIDVVFTAIGVPAKYRGSWKNRKPVAVANSILGYTGKESENLTLIELAKKGKLKK